MKGFFNGRFLTQTGIPQLIREIIVSQGTFAALGVERELRKADTEIDWIDLGGRSVVPGFVDAHCHFLLRLFSHLWRSCIDGDYGGLKYDPSPLWVRGRQPPHWTRHPSLHELDAIEPVRPMIVVEQGYHGCALNSAARRLLASQFPTVFDGLLRLPETLGDTTLTNLRPFEASTLPDSSAVYESAMGWAENVSRDWFQEQFEDALLAQVANTVHALVATGVTAVCDAAATPRLRELLGKARRSGSLRIPVTTLDVGRHGFFQPPYDAIKEAHSGESARTIKVFVDGGRQCLVERPDGRTYGHAFYSEEVLLQLCMALRRRGLKIALHAMGNGAVHRVIRVCQSLDRAHLYEPECFRLEHGAILTGGLAKSIADFRLAVVVQPHWIRWLGPRWLDAPYPNLKFLPFRTLVESGAKLAGSSDCTDGHYPSPLESIACAVSRTTGRGLSCEAEEVLDPSVALLLHTRNAAEVCGIARTHGTIEVGKQADFVVLEGDPLNAADWRAGSVATHSVYVRGELVI